MAKHLPLRTYADAYVLSLSKKTDGVGALRLFQQALSRHPAIRSYLADTSIPHEDRRNALHEIDPDAEEPVCAFILMLGEDGILGLLDRVIEQIRKSYERLASCTYAQVTSAVELTKEEQKRIEKTLSKKGEQDVRLELTVDPSVIGGLIIQKNDWLFNASVQGKLDHLKRHLNV